jgi:hypothetical protein
MQLPIRVTVFSHSRPLPATRTPLHHPFPFERKTPLYPQGSTAIGQLELRTMEVLLQPRRRRRGVSMVAGGGQRQSKQAMESE